tara:strand:- start:10 stop:378 length:369 start_codon:yes stop_codon:yes gene_type:complete
LDSTATIKTRIPTQAPKRSAATAKTRIASLEMLNVPRLHARKNPISTKMALDPQQAAIPWTVTTIIRKSFRALMRYAVMESTRTAMESMLYAPTATASIKMEMATEKARTVMAKIATTPTQQ